MNIFDNAISDKTSVIYIPNGYFMPDDLFFAALAEFAIEKTGNVPTVIRTNEKYLLSCGDVPQSVAGGFARGRYSSMFTPQKKAAQTAGQKLFTSISDTLFPGASETKALLTVLVNVVANSYMTDYTDTLSECINLFYSTDDTVLESNIKIVFQFCKEAFEGFLTAHDNERNSRLWTLPNIRRRFCDSLFTSESKYKHNFSYVRKDEKYGIELKAADTLELMLNMVSGKRRRYWANCFIEQKKKYYCEVDNTIQNIAVKPGEPVSVLPFFYPDKSNSTNLFAVIKEYKRGYLLLPVNDSFEVNSKAANSINYKGVKCYYYPSLKEAKEMFKQLYSTIEAATEKTDYEAYHKIYGTGKNDVRDMEKTLLAIIRENSTNFKCVTESEAEKIRNIVSSNKKATELLKANFVKRSGAYRWESKKQGSFNF